MTLSQNIRHRRAAAAAAILQRDPQAGFSPTAIFNRPTPSFPFPTFGVGQPGDGSGDGGDDGGDTVTVTVVVPPSSSASASSLPATTASTPTPTTSATPITTALPTTTPTLIPSKTLSPLSLSSTQASASGVAASSNANANNSDSSSISTGAIVGGIAAGIVAIAAVGFAIVFFIRRSRKRNEPGFDDNNFRRSAMVLDDPPTVEDTYNPHPPNMMERHMASPASPAPTFGTMYGRPGPSHMQDGYGDEYSQNYAGYGNNYQSFAPGQVINPYGPNAYPSSPMTAQTARPMYPGSPYTQSPFSPVSPTEQYGFHDNVPAAAGSVVNGAGYPVLTRKGSNQSHESAHGGQSELANPHRESVPASDYVDLNRSSVSPYQAAQYVEISRRLNTQPPEGLRTADIDRELPPPPPPLPGKDGSSPFADPGSAPPSPGGGQYAIDRRHLDGPSAHGRTFSGDSNLQDPQTLEFPAPPSPVHPVATRYRIDSMPPSLPEINIEASRVSVSSYPMLASPAVRDSHAPSMLTAGLTPGGAGGAGSRFPTTPSPLASSFGMPSPPPAAARAAFVPPGPPPALIPAASPTASSAEAAPAPTARQPSEHALDQQKRNTAYSMYDAEDAYGGI